MHNPTAVREENDPSFKTPSPQKSRKRRRTNRNVTVSVENEAEDISSVDDNTDGDYEHVLRPKKKSNSRKSLASETEPDMDNEMVWCLKL